MEVTEDEITAFMGSVEVNGKENNITIHGDNLTFQIIKQNATPYHHIPLRSILAVKVCEPIGKKVTHTRRFSKKTGVETPQAHSLNVYSTKISRSGKWKICKHHIVCSTPQQSQNLVGSINARIKDYVALRPQHLMVIINPRGGKKKGQSIYRKHVVNIFNLLDIKTDVFVTNFPEDARELVLENNLSKYDGIVGVGGDGTVHEIVNALLTKTQNEAGLDIDDPEVKLIRPKIKIGIIPAGSTDVIAFDTTGVNDPVTSALQIAQGFSLGLDVCSVHHNDYLLRYTLSFLGYGFFGDVIKESENYRWMGPTRYGLAGFLKYMRNRSYHGVVSYIPNDDHSHSPWDSQVCQTGCPVCFEKGEPAGTTTEEESNADQNLNKKGPKKWDSKHGEFNAINAAIICCSSRKARMGVSPAAHLGNGCVDLVLVRRCTRVQYLRYMIRVSLRGNPLDLDYVDVHRVKAFRFQTTPAIQPGSDIEQGNEATAADMEIVYGPRRSVSSTSSWNLDGEISEPPDIDVRVHCQLIQIFACGPRIQESKSSIRLAG